LKQLALLRVHQSCRLCVTLREEFVRGRRLLYGFLHPEGIRRGDAETLRWRLLDLVTGTLRIESDKTKHSRVFTLSAGVIAALKAWKGIKEPTEPNDLVMTRYGRQVASHGPPCGPTTSRS
jgi:integrase